MQAVLSFSPSNLKQVEAAYANHSVTAPNGAIFRAKVHGTTITGYRSGKVMFQGANIDHEVSRWQQQSDKSSTTNATRTGNHHHQTSSPLPTGFASWSVLGSDEVGTGSYFGPLTVAAVYVAQENLDAVKQLGIMDSKQLTDPEIIKMAKQLLTFLPYHVVNLMPAKYNQLMEHYHNQGQLKALCHNLALQKVLQKIQPAVPKAILIDQFVAPATYFRYLKGQPTIVRQTVHFQIKGEQAHLCVAAASVLARYVSLQTMDQLTEEAGITLPIGAGNAVDQIAAKLIHRGISLDRFAKLHFANTQKAETIAKQFN